MNSGTTALSPDTAGSRLLVIQTIMGLSRWLDVFLVFLVPSFAWSATPSQMAGVALAFGVPGLLLGPFLGAWLDKSNPEKGMAVGLSSGVLVVAAMAFATDYGTFLALVFMRGLANLCYWPASSIVTNAVVEEPARVRYFSTLSVFDQSAKIGTPLLAGLLALKIGSQYLFLLSAAMICMALLMLPSLFAATHARSSRLSHGVDGPSSAGNVKWRDAKLPKGLLLTVALGVATSLALAIYDPHLANYLRLSGLSVGVFSLVVAATGAGAVVGALGVRCCADSAGPTVLMRTGLAIFVGALTAATLLTKVYPEATGASTFMVVWFVNGMGYEVFLIGAGVNVQNLCPRSFLGRVSTSNRSLQMLAVVLGPVIGAWLIESWERSTPFLIATGVAWCALAASTLCLGDRTPSTAAAQRV